MSQTPSLFDAVLAQWKDFAIAMGFAMLSGMAAYLHKFKQKQPRVFSLVEFVADTLLAGVVGVTVLMICLDKGVSLWFAGAAVGFAGHAAPRILFLGEKAMIRSAEKKLGITIDDSQ